MGAQILDLPGGPLEVWRAGHGPTVLITHGLSFGLSYRSYAWVSEDLPDHHVISISRPGYGDSPLATAATFSEQASLYVDLLDALEVDDCVIVGVSASGPVALLAAHLHAARVRGLVLWGALARGLATHRLEVFDGDLDGAALGRESTEERAMFTRALSDDSFAHEMLPALLQPIEMLRYDSDPALRADVRTYLEHRVVSPSGVEGVRNDFVQLRSLLGEGFDSTVDVPVMIMHGSEDETVPVEHARYHAEQNRSAELHVFEGAGLGFMLTFRPQVMTTLRAFLERT